MKNLADDYRQQLGQYLSPRDCERIVPLLVKPPQQLTIDDQAVLADAAMVIRHVRQTV